MRDFLVACLLVSSVGLASAADINVNSWNELNNNREILDNNYILNGNISPSYSISVGTNVRIMVQCPKFRGTPLKITSLIMELAV